MYEKHTEYEPYIKKDSLSEYTIPYKCCLSVYAIKLKGTLINNFKKDNMHPCGSKGCKIARGQSLRSIKNWFARSLHTNFLGKNVCWRGLRE